MWKWYESRHVLDWEMLEWFHADKENCKGLWGPGINDGPAERVTVPCMLMIPQGYVKWCVSEQRMPHELGALFVAKLKKDSFVLQEVNLQFTIEWCVVVSKRAISTADSVLVFLVLEV